MTIGQVAKAAGLSTSAIRYYEAAGIIPRPARKSGQRSYDPAMVDELKALRFYRASGIPIRGLVSIARHIRGSGARREAWVSMLKTRIAGLELEMRQAEMASEKNARFSKLPTQCQRNNRQ